jgi:hypothetical protein
MKDFTKRPMEPHERREGGLPLHTEDAWLAGAVARRTQILSR